ALGVDPDMGELVKAFQIDPNLQDGVCGCGSGTVVPNGEEGLGAINAIANVVGDPALVYSNITAYPRPIIYADFISWAADGVPTDIKVGIVFNGSSPVTLTYATTGHSAGDTYRLAAELPLVALGIGGGGGTGRYGYTLTMQ